MLEFQDLQLAYAWATIAGTNPPKNTTERQPEDRMDRPGVRHQRPVWEPDSGKTDPGYDWSPLPGTQSVNYRNEPIAWRVGAFE